MKLSSLKSPERWDIHLSSWSKRLRRWGRGPTNSRPLFVCGQQRSGTTMMMVVLRLHPDTEVHDESRDSEAFVDYCLRDLRVVDEIISRSRAPVVCFKPLMDSHRAPELLERYPRARILWMLRHYQDMANSTLRQFEDPNVNLRRIMKGEEGAEGLRRETSEVCLEILRTFNPEQLGEPDLACLRWWIRNRILLERSLVQHERVRVQPYEQLVEGGRPVMDETFRWAGLRPSSRANRHVHARSVGKNPAPDLHPEVDRLCRQLHETLLEACERRNVPYTT